MCRWTHLAASYEAAGRGRLLHVVLFLVSNRIYMLHICTSKDVMDLPIFPQPRVCIDYRMEREADEAPKAGCISTKMVN